MGKLLVPFQVGHRELCANTELLLGGFPGVSPVGPGVAFALVASTELRRGNFPGVSPIGSGVLFFAELAVGLPGFCVPFAQWLRGAADDQLDQLGLAFHYSKSSSSP